MIMELIYTTSTTFYHHKMQMFLKMYVSTYAILLTQLISIKL